MRQRIRSVERAAKGLKYRNNEAPSEFAREIAVAGGSYIIDFTIGQSFGERQL
jgi:hypothetical protein